MNDPTPRLDWIEKDLDKGREGRLSTHEQLAKLRQSIVDLRKELQPFLDAKDKLEEALGVLESLPQRVQSLEDNVGPLAFLKQHVERIKAVLGLR